MSVLALARRLGIQTTGYRPHAPGTDLLLGAFISVDYILWGYTFAALMFTGSLAPYLPVAVSVILVSTAIIALGVALSSRFPVNIAGNEPQAVAILATVSMLMNERWSEFASVDAAAATLFAIMAVSALLLGLSFFLMSYFRLSPLLQMMPFPVVCGFLAGTGWLFVGAGVAMVTDIELELLHLGAQWASPALPQLALALLCGLLVYAAVVVWDHFLTLPLALLACGLGFYAVAGALGVSAAELRSAGWLFQMDHSAAAKELSDLALADIHLGFVVSVLPEIGTIVLISLLTATFSFSALELGTGINLDPDVELRGHGAANVASGLLLGLPGSVEIGSSVMFHNLGASSRWLGLMCGASCLTAAFAGGGVVEWVPKLVMATVVFVVGFQFIHEWMIKMSKDMLREDFATVLLIFGTIVAAGFIAGVVVGIALSSLLFIIRTGKVDVVDSTLSLQQISSSVERSAAEHAVLRAQGQSVRVFNLHGFLFFGTANGFFERIRALCEQGDAPQHLVFNLRRVIGVDSTAAQVFVKLQRLLQARQLSAHFCALQPQVRPVFDTAKVFDEGLATVHASLDAALHQVEDQLLAQAGTRRTTPTIQGILTDLLGDAHKASLLLPSLERLELRDGDHLFRQGDADTALYILEAGALAVQLEHAARAPTRLRLFGPGSLVGEMATYSTHKVRSASAVATEASVVYRLRPDALPGDAAAATETAALLHEMVARQLVARIGYMNQRTAAEL